MYLFFDTETTGLPTNWKAPVSDSKNWPRMIQIAWEVYDNISRKIDSQEFIIKPEGFLIPKEASAVHGITTEKAIIEGQDLTEILKFFNLQIENADFIIAHNISFDEKIIGAEFYRKKIETGLFSKKRLCTMLASVDYCGIPGRYGNKWPKLSELHIKLFDEDFKDAHNAASDINATARCFWELKKRGVIQ
jgi:DNA polymerase III epsilon subunit-like protein